MPIVIIKTILYFPYGYSEQTCTINSIIIIHEHSEEQRLQLQRPIVSFNQFICTAQVMDYESRQY